MRKIVSAIVAMVCLLTGQVLFAAGDGPGVSAEEVLKMLEEGNARYVSGTATHYHQDQARRTETSTKGQFPFVTVISCSDSRVPVEIVFDQGVGDTFVIRVAGNVVDVDEAGSIEYGVDHLNTPVLLVLGHSSCGACTAVVTGAQVHGNIPPLVDNIIPAVKKTLKANPSLAGQDLIDAVIKQNVWQGIEDLYSISPVSVKRVKEGKLMVIGGIYDLATGKVEFLGEHPEQDKLLEKVKHITIWNPDKAYKKGEKVTHYGKVWEAKKPGKKAEPGATNKWKLVK